MAIVAFRLKWLSAVFKHIGLDVAVSLSGIQTVIKRDGRVDAESELGKWIT